MIKRVIFMVLAVLLSTVPGALAPSFAFAAPTAASQALCEGADDGSANVSCTGETSATTVSGIVRTAIRIFQSIIGIISLFVMLTGGLNYITSGGDSAKTKSARERIMYAVIGLVIVGVAEILVQFALNRAIE